MYCCRWRLRAWGVARGWNSHYTTNHRYDAQVLGRISGELHSTVVVSKRRIYIPVPATRERCSHVSVTPKTRAFAIEWESDTVRFPCESHVNWTVLCCRQSTEAAAQKSQTRNSNGVGPTHSIARVRCCNAPQKIARCSCRHSTVSV